MTHQHRWGWTRIRWEHRHFWWFQSCQERGCNAERRRKIF